MGEFSIRFAEHTYLVALNFKALGSWKLWELVVVCP